MESPAPSSHELNTAKKSSVWCYGMGKGPKSPDMCLGHVVVGQNGPIRGPKCQDQPENWLISAPLGPAVLEAVPVFGHVALRV